MSDGKPSPASGDAPRNGDIAVDFNAALNRYEVTVAGKVAGYAAFSYLNGVYVFDHTVVDPAYQGQGLAGKLVAGALADVVARGERFAATCSYVTGWLERHHEFDQARVPVP